MNKKVFLKVIIPNYNNFPYIKKCLDSIINQTFNDWVCVIVDDLSTDNSDRVAQIYANRYPDHFIFTRMSEKGHEGGCRNHGIEYPIDCEYYYFIDSDDWLSTNTAFEIIYDNLSDKKDDVLIFNMYTMQNGQTITVNLPRFDWTSNKIAYGYSSACLKVVKKEIMKPFLVGCDCAADTYQAMRIFNQHPRIKQIDDVLYVYNRHSTSISLNGRLEADKELFYRKFQELLDDEITEPNVRRSMEDRIRRHKLGFKI